MNKKDLERLKENLPSKPGILRRDEYFNSAVLIPLIFIDDEYHFLFEKRAVDIRQGGEICFPGGEVDKDSDKNFKATAVREAVEELGIYKSKIKIIGILDTLVGPMGVTVDSVIGEIKIKNINELKIDKKEVEKIFTVPVSFFQHKHPDTYNLRVEVHSSYTEKDGKIIELFPAKQLNLPERYHGKWQVRNQKVFVYKTAGEVIWGITAILVHELVRKLK